MDMLSIVAKHVGILLRAKASVSVTIRTAGRIYHGTTPKFEAKSNGPTGLQDFKFPAALTNEITSYEGFEQTDYIAERNENWRQNRPSESHFPPGPRGNHPLEDRKEVDKSVEDTVAALEYKEKETRDNHLDGRKDAETTHDSEVYKN